MKKRRDNVGLMMIIGGIWVIYDEYVFGILRFNGKEKIIFLVWRDLIDRC